MCYYFVHAGHFSTATISNWNLDTGHIKKKKVKQEKSDLSNTSEMSTKASSVNIAKEDDNYSNNRSTIPGV